MIESKLKTILKDPRTLYLKKLNDYASNHKNNLILSHFGNLSLHLIIGLSNALEKDLTLKNENQILIKKIYSISNEGLHNILIHGKKNEIGKKIAFFLVAKDKDNYTVDFANLISQADCQRLSDYIIKLNNMDMDEMKVLYKNALQNGYLAQKGGGGLGLLLMRMKSGQPISFDFYPLNEDYCIFNFIIHIQR
jgi:hypothetical protein